MARDPHLRARSSDRNAAISAIQTAYAQGLIGDADRTLRVANAEQASTVGELDLLTRDLVPETPPADSPPPTPGSTPPTTPSAASGESWPTYSPPAQAPPKNASPYAGRAPRVGGSSKVGLIVAGVMFVAVTGASGMIANFGGEGGVGSDGIEFGEPRFDDPGFDDPALDDPAIVDDPYELSAPGIDAFIGLLEDQFGTSAVLRAVFYPDYVSVDVPTDDGRARHQSWVYRDSTLTQLGGPRANTTGDRTVDLREVSLDGLQVSLDTARTDLGVEAPDTTYAIVSHTWAQDQGTVAIHVANEFSESAHLTTDLQGRELRRFPFVS